MPEFVIRSRITPKKSQGNVIQRARLIKEIDANRQKNLVLVCAPAGYGKTTLVQEYLSAYSVPFAWFHVSTEVGNFYTFVVYIVHALRTLDKDLGANTLEAVESLKQSMNLVKDLKNSVTIVIGTLINDILNSASPEITIVLDDLHEAQDTDWFKTAFDTLLDDFPPNLRLIITSRNIPDFNFAKLTAKRNILNIDSKKLHFSRNEIDELMNNIYSIKSSGNDSEILEKSLNGWITGIHLVLQAYGENFRTADLSSGDIFEFFAGEVFAGLNDDLKNFLLDTCYLDSFTPDDCDIILGTKTSKQIIDELINRNIFIESASYVSESGKRTNTYSYHKLFKEFLSLKLHESRDGAEIKETLRRIYNFYISRNDLSSALGFSLFAKDIETSTELIKKVFDREFEDNQFEKLWKWISEFPDEIIQGDASLLYYKGLLLRLYRGDLEGALAHMQKGVNLTNRSADNRLYIDINIQAAETLRLLGKPNDSLSVLESVSALNPSPSDKAKILYSLAYTLYRIGPEKYKRIGEIIDEGVKICSENELDSQMLNFYNLLGLINSHRGDIIKGIHYYELALLKEKYILSKMKLMNNIIPLYVWSGNYARAKELLEKAETMNSLFPSVILKRLLLRTKALFYFEFGDYETAIAALEELIRTDIKNNNNRFLFINYLFIGECYFFLNKPELAGRYYEIMLENIDPADSYQKLENDLHIAILKKQTGADDSVEPALMNALNYFEDNSLVYARAQVEFHLADYYYKKGLKDTALKFLKDSLEVSAANQYVSYLEQLYPLYRYLFDFAVSNYVSRDFLKSVLQNIAAKEEFIWISAAFRKRLGETIDLLSDISFKAFGGADLSVRGKHVDEDRWVRKKSKLILAYLLLNQGAKFTKDKILGLFFGDLNSASAENVFHQAITNIRSALRFEEDTGAEIRSKEKTKAKKPASKKEKEAAAGPEYILYEDKILRLNPDYVYKVDAVEFNAIYHKIKSAETSPEVKMSLGAKAMGSYKGELLAGNYDDWCEELRTNYANKFAELCEEMISLYKKMNKPDEIIEYAERLLQADRLHEEAYIDLIEAYVNSGKANMAKTKFSQMLKTYDEEYGEKPPRKVMDRIGQLLDGKE